MGQSTKKQKEFIFDSFFTTKDNGTGLGLSIVYQIINNHQVSITILDNTKSGAIFRITLPKLVKARKKRCKMISLFFILYTTILVYLFSADFNQTRNSKMGGAVITISTALFLLGSHSLFFAIEK